MTTLARAAVDRIEALIQQEVGRNIAGLFEAARGGLWGAASALASAPRVSVGLITGFYVPLGAPPAAETDGPVGAAMLAAALRRVGATCRVATDEPCRATCAAALQGIDVPLDVVPFGGTVEQTIARWCGFGVTHAISIERCGRSADGAPRNMRGEDIGAFTLPLDSLFLAPSTVNIPICFMSSRMLPARRSKPITSTTKATSSTTTFPLQHQPVLCSCLRQVPALNSGFPTNLLLA